MPIFGILRIFVKKENIALFIASDMYRYSGNTKYLYQYFNTHSNDKCYWITESEEVMNHLESLKGQITIVFITHSSAAIKNCDQVIRIVDGQLYT